MWLKLGKHLPQNIYCIHILMNHDSIYFQAEIYAEIGEVINGSKQAHWEKTTIFKSVGKATYYTFR